MERHEVLDLMKALRLSGMRAAFDEIVDTALKRQHPIQRVLGDLLKAEIADKKARSIKYQMTIAKLPMAKEMADFDFCTSPVNEPLVRDLATGAFLEGKRNLVLVGGTGSGKTHLSVAIARACIRNGARARCYNVVDLVNHLDAEARVGNQGRTANQLCRRDLVILDELGYLLQGAKTPSGANPPIDRPDAAYREPTAERASLFRRLRQMSTEARLRRERPMCLSDNDDIGSCEVKRIGGHVAGRL